MNSGSILLKNANVIDEEGNILKNVNIFMNDGVIDRITMGNTEEVQDNTILCNEYFITPGFVNLHAHSPMNIFKGIAEDVNIDDWFNKEIWPYESNMTKDDAYYGALSAIDEMLDNGVTAFADHYMFADSICDAVIESGIRGDIAPTIFGMGEDFDKQLNNASMLIEEKKGKNNRLKLRMGPHAPYTCPGNTLSKIIDRAKKLDVGIHIHLSETKDQVEDSKSMYGKTPFEVLKDAGGFDVDAIIAHSLWISEDDRKYIKDNTYIAACPKTYMKLSMGYGHIWDKSFELPLCIGTDGAASSNTLNPLEQARLFALIGKFIKNDPEGFNLKYIWRILMNGHNALDFNTGKIAEGYAADLLIWDLNNSATLPLYSPLASIIYSSSSRNIIHSIIDGKFVKKDGKVIAVKTKAKDSLNSTAKSIIKRGRGNTNLIF